jgi:hypothetical protein
MTRKLSVSLCVFVRRFTEIDFLVEALADEIDVGKSHCIAAPIDTLIVHPDGSLSIFPVSGRLLHKTDSKSSSSHGRIALYCGAGIVR